jgi:hypothetical protein
MRTALLVFLLVACGAPKQRVDPDAPFVEVAENYGPVVSVLAAYRPLLGATTGDTLSRHLATAARRAIARDVRLAPRGKTARSDDALLVGVAVDKVRTACAEPDGETPAERVRAQETANRACAESLDSVEAALVSVNGRAPKGVEIPLLSRPPETEAAKQAERFRASLAPGAATSRWLALRADPKADPAALEPACAAAGDEWATRLETAPDVPVVQAAIDSVAAQCLMLLSVRFLAEMAPTCAAAEKPPGCERQCELLYTIRSSGEAVPAVYAHAVDTIARRCPAE